jgi:hypothetical protein
MMTLLKQRPLFSHVVFEVAFRCEAESCDHLFLSCPIVISVWTDLFLWMGVEAVTAVECVDHFLRFSSRLKGKSWRKWRHIFWLSTM